MHGLETLVNAPQIPAFLPILLPFLIFIVPWTIAWKGWALWVAARNKSQVWFILLLLVNTLGILEIIYIFAVGKPALKKGMPAAPTTPAN
jgi:methionyl-tRNA synthetase